MTVPLDDVALNQVVLLGVVESEPLLRVECAPFRLSFALRVPAPPTLAHARDALVTVVKEGNQAVEVAAGIHKGKVVLVTGALRSQFLDGRGMQVWVQGLGIRTADHLRYLPGGELRRINQVLLLGNVARAAEVRTGASRPYLTFLLSVRLPAWTKCHNANLFRVCRRGNGIFNELPRLLERGNPVIVQGALRSYLRGKEREVEVYAVSIQ